MRQLKIVSYRPQKWSHEASPVDLHNVSIHVFENAKGMLDFHFMHNDETFKVVKDACPHDFDEESFDSYWSGLEDGFELGRDYL